MLSCSLSDKVFNFADPVQSLAGVLFGIAICFQFGVVGNFPDGFLDRSLNLVKLACCLIVRARLYHGCLLCFVCSYQLKRFAGQSKVSCYATSLPAGVCTCTSSSNSER